MHCSYYLVCKAGAGVAGQTFHARLCAALKQGASLDEALSETGTPGARALVRVAAAARRNRARILSSVADALQFFSLDSIGDHAGPVGCEYRTAIPSIDVTYNSLTHVCSEPRSTWQYASGCVDASVSTGMVISSNVSEGFVAFASPNGDTRVSVRNDAHCCVPFSTPRLMTTRDAMLYAVDQHKKARKEGSVAHPDSEWLRLRFIWTSKQFEKHVDIEPPSLWGSHGKESFLADWARELGVSRLSPIRLQPEIVCLSALEMGKLRVAVKSVSCCDDSR